MCGFQNASRLGLCGGVGIRAFFLDGDTSLDLVGEVGGGGVDGLIDNDERSGYFTSDVKLSGVSVCKTYPVSCITHTVALFWLLFSLSE